MSEASVLPQYPWVRRRKLDVHDYHRMGEAGILTREDRVELIDGELLEMSPIGVGHVGTVIALTHLLMRQVADRAFISVQSSVRLDEYNEPEPDFAVLRPPLSRYREALPGVVDVLLLVEVADSSLRFDRAVKLPLYGRHGIPEVWIVDVEGGAVEVCRGPRLDGYAEIARAGRGQSIGPATLPGVTLAVTDIVGEG
jgi:Uma2 family endonuclease